MSSRIERILIALALASGVTTCSSHEEVVVTITRDAQAPEIVTCTPSERFAFDVGLDLQVILDRSDQFGDWDGMKFALSSAFFTSEFRGINVGVTLYPAEDKQPESRCMSTCGAVPSCGCLRNNCDCGTFEPKRDGGCDCVWWQTACDSDDYTKPYIELSPLGPEGEHFGKLNSVTSEGFAALSPAINGSIRYRNAWEAAHPGRRITQLIVAGTDFDGCANDSRLDESERALTGADKPKTYVATYNEPESYYDRLAVAGRTEGAIRIRPSARPPPPPIGDVIDLIRHIRDAEGRCEYLLPEPLEVLDYRKINLASATDGQVYARVPSAEACARTPMGWYYDAPIADRPTHILTCPETCKSLHTLGPAPATIQLGCPTINSKNDGGT